MPGFKAEIRSKALSIRCYNLRKEGYTLSEIAEEDQENFYYGEGDLFV